MIADNQGYLVLKENCDDNLIKFINMDTFNTMTTIKPKSIKLPKSFSVSPPTLVNVSASNANSLFIELAKSIISSINRLVTCIKHDAIS